MSQHTRIKICGLTRQEDLDAAVLEGADAIGFVFYAKSPRYVEPQSAGELIRTIPPFVTPVGLFVNASAEDVTTTLQQAPVGLLQFHGDESVEQCCMIADRVKKPFIRAVRVRPETAADDLIKCDKEYRASSKWFAGLLLDAFDDGYGGSGKVFNWSLIPKELAPRLVLSGGLNAHNATEAVCGIRPFAVDISSGVEQAKGIKDAVKIRAFVDAVRRADATIS